MGRQQTWTPAEYQRHAGFVAELGAGVLEWLAPKPHERILDLGCGDGVLTDKLRELGCDVVGVDSSAAQIAAAQQRGLTASVQDGEALSFDSEFDAVFSNAALHWMRRPDAVIDGVRRALRTQGRFVAEFGGYGCVAKIRGALSAALVRRGVAPEARDPWYFPTQEEYAGRLERGGFKVRSITLFERPTPLPTDIEGWLETFAQSFTAAVPPEEHSAFITEVRDALAPQLRDADGRWFADYVRLRFHADKL
jgi:SAM-dependent methyltransferase